MTHTLLDIGRMCRLPPKKRRASCTWHRFEIPKEDIDELISLYEFGNSSMWAFCQKHCLSYKNDNYESGHVGWETFRRAFERARGMQSNN